MNRQTLVAGLTLSLLSLPVTAIATDPLDSIQGRLVRGPLLRASFVQEKRIAGFPRPFVSKGQIIAARDLGVVWSTESPFPSIVVVDRAGFRTVPSGAEAGRAGVGSQGAGAAEAMRKVSQIVAAVVSGDLAALRTPFSLTAVPPDANATPEGWALKLVPTDPGVGSVLEQIRLEGDNVVRIAVIQERNGDVTVIRFEGHRVEPPLTPVELRHFQQ